MPPRARDPGPEPPEAPEIPEKVTNNIKTSRIHCKVSPLEAPEIPEKVTNNPENPKVLILFRP